MTAAHERDVILDAVAVIRASARGDQQAMENILNHGESSNIALAITEIFHVFINDELDGAEAADAYFDTLQRGLLHDRAQGSDTS
jgi:predicted nucleic acid-binding protein